MYCIRVVLSFHFASWQEMVGWNETGVEFKTEESLGRHGCQSECERWRNAPRNGGTRWNTHVTFRSFVNSCLKYMMIWPKYLNSFLNWPFYYWPGNPVQEVAHPSSVETEEAGLKLGAHFFETTLVTFEILNAKIVRGSIWFPKRLWINPEGRGITMAI